MSFHTIIIQPHCLFTIVVEADDDFLKSNLKYDNLFGIVNFYFQGKQPERDEISISHP